MNWWQVYYRLRGRDFAGQPFEPYRDAINNAIGLRQMFLLGAFDRTLTIGYQWSDNDPASGSVNASMTTASPTAVPASAPGRPSTWL